MTILPAFILSSMVGALVALAFGFRKGRLPPIGASIGNVGEALVVDEITLRLSRPHVLLNNVTLKSERGTTQIDHILVSDTGVFVIETKHYTGWIFGSQYDENWTKIVYKKKFLFLNPIRQNYGHLKALQALFNLPANNFISVVVFTGNAEFKTEVGPEVVKLSGLMNLLNAERPVVINETKMAYVVGRIEMKRLRRSIETDEYHLNSVRSRIQGRLAARASWAKKRTGELATLSRNGC